MKVIFACLSIFAIFTGLGFIMNSGTASATEKPNYRVLKADGKFEIRDYPKMILAEVTVEGNRRTANSRGFRKLAAFIFGDNLSQDKVAMTAPVVSRPQKIAMTAPVVSIPQDVDLEMSGKNQLELPRTWIVTFMMPSEYTLETLPKPTDSDIRIVETETYQTISIQYNGNNTPKNIAKHESLLRAYIKEHGLKVTGGPEYAGYDAPWVPGPLKRNEVHFRLGN